MKPASISATVAKNEFANPDEAARRILAVNVGMTQADANGAAWQEGRRLLEHAIARRRDFAFETTLGGRTITDRIEQAMAAGKVRIWYVGLAGVELHIARVVRGGHDIPEERIRQRYDQSRLNLIRLLSCAINDARDPVQPRRLMCAVRV